MTQVDVSQQLIAAARTQLTRLQQSRGHKPGSGDTGSAQVPPDSKSSAQRADAFGLAARIRALSPNDPDRPGKAFRCYMGALLSRELGWDAADEIGLFGLVDQVVDQMKSDPMLQQAMTKAGERLLQEHPK